MTIHIYDSMVLYPISLIMTLLQSNNLNPTLLKDYAESKESRPALVECAIGLEMQCALNQTCYSFGSAATGPGRRLKDNFFILNFVKVELFRIERLLN